MPVTQVGAIYAVNSLLLQRIYIPHADDSEIIQQPVIAGEAIIMVPLATYVQGGVPAIQAAVGIPAHSGRCAVVDASNKVIDHLTAEPKLYSDPRGQVIQHDLTNIGDTWDGAQFNRRYVELDATSGKVAGSSTQPILAAKPKINAANYLIPASVAPNAIPGSAVPVITAQIVARVAAKAV